MVCWSDSATWTRDCRANWLLATRCFWGGSTRAA
jgi:hypothetical protein